MSPSMTSTAVAPVTRRRPRRIVTWIVGIAVVLALLALAGQRGFEAWRSPRLIAVDGKSLLVREHYVSLTRRGEGAGMGILGSLGLVRGTCVGLTGDAQTVLAWAPGTEMVSKGDSFEVRVEGKVFKAGDQIEGGGSPITTLTSLLPPECRGLNVMAFDPLETPAP